MKRKVERIDDHLQKERKKQKHISVVNEDESRNAEMLNIQTLREGMLLLGTIIEIRPSCILMSLPGCLVGIVPVTNICNKYTEILKDISESGGPEEAPLQTMFKLGSILPCKVLQIIQSISKKPSIILSVDPEAVNSNLRISSLYTKMVLFTAVKSIEDRGYIMETGINDLRGFLPFENTNSSELLHLGQIVPTYINKLPSQKSTGNVILLNYLSYESTFPVVSNEDIKISSLLPGAHVKAYISEISESFVFLKCFSFEAFSSTLNIHRNLKKLQKATEVSGTVLYVHPVTNVLYLHLGSLSTPSTFDNFFSVQKYDKVKNVKFVCSLQNKLYFKFEKSMGYVKDNDVSKKSSLSRDSLKKNSVVPKARVVFRHYMDNLIQLTFDESLLKMKIVKPQDVKIGDIFKSTVKKHVEDGMFVSICPGLTGFVRYIFFSDSYITKPEKFHPVGSQVECRVLSRNSNSNFALTCKESLLTLPSESLLDDYKKATKGETFKGVIVKKTEEYVIVLFFNNVQGIVASENIPKSSIFYVGQTVNCIVLHCNPAKRKMQLSLNPEFEDTELNNSKKQTESSKSFKLKSSTDGMKMTLMKDDDKIKLPSPTFNEGKAYKAIIKKITAHQLNVLVNCIAKGRVHITQTGCSNEDEFPLKGFVVGQQIKVYVLKSFERRSQNYLSISHQNKTSFLECSLVYPPCIPLENSVNSSKPLIGFVKKVYDTFALVWLSPYHFGKLDFVNMSENPKMLRNMKKKLTLSQSLTVIAFNDIASSAEPGEIMLTKPGISVPDVGENVVGLLNIGSPDRKLVLKLPYDYTGFVCLTDIQDVYTPLQPVIEKLLKLKFILSHVLKVDHHKKICHLSLRKSRLYNKSFKCIKNASPELSLELIKQGRTVKSYIKSILSSCIIVNIGRNVYGKVELHKCSKYECMICLKINEAMKTFAIGSVVEVVINSTVPEKGFIPLSFPSISNTCSEGTSALDVGADINWNELL